MKKPSFLALLGKNFPEKLSGLSESATILPRIRPCVFLSATLSSIILYFYFVFFLSCFKSFLTFDSFSQSFSNNQTCSISVVTFWVSFFILLCEILSVLIFFHDCQVAAVKTFYQRDFYLRERISSTWPQFCLKLHTLQFSLLQQSSCTILIVQINNQIENELKHDTLIT